MELSVREIAPRDDASLAAIIRRSLEAHHLDLPGTAYFDLELDRLSDFYLARPGRRYFVVEDAQGNALGGVGVAEYRGHEESAELQKLYLDDRAKGYGWGSRLIEMACTFARETGYRRIYLETHHALSAAVHLYQKAGFVPVETGGLPTVHSTMDLFLYREFQ